MTNKMRLAWVVALLVAPVIATSSFAKLPSPAQFGNLVSVLNAYRIFSENCGLQSASTAKRDVLLLFSGYGIGVEEIEKEIDNQYVIEKHLIGSACELKYVNSYKAHYFSRFKMMNTTLSE